MKMMVVCRPLVTALTRGNTWITLLTSENSSSECQYVRQQAEPSHAEELTETANCHEQYYFVGNPLFYLSKILPAITIIALTTPTLIYLAK